MSGVLKAEARDIVRRLLREKIAPKVTTPSTIGPTCRTVAAGLPEALLRDLAAAYLATAYHEDAEDFRPKRKYQRRKPVALSPEIQADLDAELDLIDRRFWDGIDSLVGEFKTAMRNEITAELLAQTFTLKDGTTVGWGEADASQHRLASLEHQASAVEQVRESSLHEAALDMLRESGATCLNDCVGEVAA